MKNYVKILEVQGYQTQHGHNKSGMINGTLDAGCKFSPTQDAAVAS